MRLPRSAPATLLHCGGSSPTTRDSLCRGSAVLPKDARPCTWLPTGPATFQTVPKSCGCSARLAIVSLNPLRLYTLTYLQPLSATNHHPIVRPQPLLNKHSPLEHPPFDGPFFHSIVARERQNIRDTVVFYHGLIWHFEKHLWLAEEHPHVREHARQKQLVGVREDGVYSHRAGLRVGPGEFQERRPT